MTETVSRSLPDLDLPFYEDVKAAPFFLDVNIALYYTTRLLQLRSINLMGMLVNVQRLRSIRTNIQRSKQVLGKSPPTSNLFQQLTQQRTSTLSSALVQQYLSLTRTTGSSTIPTWVKVVVPLVLITLVLAAIIVPIVILSGTGEYLICIPFRSRMQLDIF